MKKLLALIFITALFSCSSEDDSTNDDSNNPDPTPTTYKLGGIGPGGGRIFQLDNTGQHGMEVTSSLGLVKWGNLPRNPVTQILMPVPNLGVIVGTGQENTNKIINHIGSNAGEPYAAKICFDLVQNGKDDWYLPSREELYLLLNYFKYQNPIPDFFSVNESLWSSSHDINDPADPDPYNSAPLLNVWCVDWHSQNYYWRQHLYIQSPLLELNVRAIRNF